MSWEEPAWIPWCTLQESKAKGGHLTRLGTWRAGTADKEVRPKEFSLGTFIVSKWTVPKFASLFIKCGLLLWRKKGAEILSLLWTPFILSVVYLFAQAKCECFPHFEWPKWNHWRQAMSPRCWGWCWVTRRESPQNRFWAHPLRCFKGSQPFCPHSSWRFPDDNSCCLFLLPAASCRLNNFIFTFLQLDCIKEKNKTTRLSV